MAQLYLYNICIQDTQSSHHLVTSFLAVPNCQSHIWLLYDCCMPSYTFTVSTGKLFQVICLPSCSLLSDSSLLSLLLASLLIFLHQHSYYQLLLKETVVKKNVCNSHDWLEKKKLSLHDLDKWWIINGQSDRACLPDKRQWMSTMVVLSGARSYYSWLPTQLPSKLSVQWFTSNLHSFKLTDLILVGTNISRLWDSSYRV